MARTKKVVGGSSRSSIHDRLRNTEKKKDTSSDEKKEEAKKTDESVVSPKKTKKEGSSNDEKKVNKKRKRNGNEEEEEEDTQNLNQPVAKKRKLNEESDEHVFVVTHDEEVLGVFSKVGTANDRAKKVVDYVEWDEEEENLGVCYDQHGAISYSTKNLPDIDEIEDIRVRRYEINRK